MSEAPPSTGSLVLDDVAEVIGSAAALALAWEFLGLRLYIPVNPETCPDIGVTIGDELAAKLCAVFGGTIIPLPAKRVLEDRILTLARAGVTKQAIARQCRITEQRVYRILARNRASAGDDQIALPLI